MKTKNIFRMLLVAAALLMGANNVKAEDIASLSVNVSVNSYWPPVSVEIPQGTFANAQESQILLLEGTNMTSLQSVFAAQSNQNQLPISAASSTTCEIELTADGASYLSSTSYLSFTGMGVTITKITLKTPPSYEINGITTIWENSDGVYLGGSLNVKLKKNWFENVSAGYVLRVYGKDCNNGNDIRVAIAGSNDGNNNHKDITSKDTRMAVWNNFIDIAITGDVLSEIVNYPYIGLVGQNFNTVKVEIVPSALITYQSTGSVTFYENSNGRQINGGADGGFYISTWILNGASDGTIVRLTGSATNNDPQIKLRDGNSDNDILNVKTVTDGHVDLVLTSTILTQLKAYKYFKVVGQNFTTTKAEIIFDGNGSSETPTTYSITIDSDIQNGSVEVDGDTSGLEAGDLVTLIATPDEGYEFDEWNVTYGNNTIEVTNNQFSMPASDVTVSATFKVVQQQQEETYELVIGENIVWDEEEVEFGATWDATHISFTKEWFNDVDPDEYTNTVRIYGDFTNNSWVLQFKVDSENWPALSVWGSDNDNQADNTNVSVQTNNKGTYIEFTITPTILNEIKDVTNCIIQGINCTVSQVVINVADKSTPTEKQDMVLRFAKSSDTATVDDDYTAPALYANDVVVDDPTTLKIRFSSSDRSVATVDEWGIIEIKAAGETTITAFFPGNDTYNEAEASFTLTVSAATQPEPEDYDYINVTGFSHGYRTYVTEDKIDFSHSDNVKGYYASGVSDSKVVFTQVTGVCAADVPLLLVKEGTGDCKLLVSESRGTTPENNLLKAGEQDDTDDSQGKLYGGNGTRGIYVLVYRENIEDVIFVETNINGARVDADHAYLDLSSVSNASSRLRISFKHGDDDSTGISNIEAESISNGVIYNLRGQRVENPTKGLYIINGKKVVIK